MATEYSVEVCKKLEQKIQQAKLYRPGIVEHYDKGDELVYDMTTVEFAVAVRVRLVVEKFVGGGFAGQVYQVRVTNIESDSQLDCGIEVGQLYAIKILIPPSGFSLLFRNVIYWIGFQGPFQLQVNPAASRAGALWQKFIRKAAAIRFGDEQSVVDIHATFVDENLGSCGELSQWVQGRTWRLEVDDHLDVLKLWKKGRDVGLEKLGNVEYRAKREFMADFVKLLHEVGGHEFARQYEWSTCKSQPNCLKRSDTEDEPERGLVAVDFRAGLALLPFLPMSPGDFKLIIKGVGRGSLVQFDRGDLGKLKAFVESHKQHFVDSDSMMTELESAERIYRDSLVDITHNHLRLLYSGRLWSTIFDSAVTGWKVRNLIDAGHEKKFRSNKFLTLVFFIIGIVPILGAVLRKFWGRADWRKHYLAMLSDFGYLKRAVKAKVAEKVMACYRAGRFSEGRAEKVGDSLLRFLPHLPFLILPVGIHKFLTDWTYFKDRLAFIVIRPAKLYFKREFREQWFRDMVEQGRKKHILTDEDAEVVLSKMKEPFIQKYLKCLAVHVCTLPVTQIVSVLIAGIYYFTHRDNPNAWAIGLGIIGIFQVVPISPGSLCRGFYVVYLVVRERNFKDYNIAVFLGFFKYIGYLAFPIQMAYHYPTIARFMAGHWATEAVHIVPVFGEGGALLEHWVFNLFYNWPLTIRRRMEKIAVLRVSLRPRYFHVAIVAIAATAGFVGADAVYQRLFGYLPSLKEIWPLALLLPLGAGAITTLYCGGAALYKRTISACLCGFFIAIFFTAALVILFGESSAVSDVVSAFVWRVFIFSIFSTVGALITEMSLSDPDLMNV